MCGRYVLTGGRQGIPLSDFGIEEIEEEFNETKLVPDFLPVAPRYNAAPTQVMPVVVARPPRTLCLMRWGLIPSWAKDVSIGAKLINARAENLPPEAYGVWLGTGDCAEVDRLLVPYPAGDMACYAVSDRINKASEEGPASIEPVTPAAEQRDLWDGAGS